VIVGNQQHQRRTNLSLVMAYLRRHAGVSRATLAQATGLTRSAITGLVRMLRDAGLLVEDETPQATTVGRPAVGLRISPQAPPVLGVELRPRSGACVVLGMDGTPREHREWETDRRVSLSEGWRLAVEHFPSDVDTAWGIGVALPATVNPHTGRILQSRSFSVKDHDRSTWCPNPLGARVVLENDANALAWGAVGHGDGVIAVMGRLRDDEPSFRIGTGLVLNGSVFYGPDWGAGEFRSARWRGSLQRPSSTDRDAALLAALEEWLESLGVAISMLRPRRVLYGGDLVNYRDHIEAVLSGPLAGSAVDPTVSGVPLSPVESSTPAVATGAARMMVERLFALPSGDNQRVAAVPRWDQLVEQGVAT
jgi:predicted NBD/HSP70 family sugar kinase